MKFAVAGEALIDFILGDDGAYRPHLGGSPFNVAISLARQGLEVGYFSCLSDDGFGDQLFKALEFEGVKYSIKRRSKLPSSLAMINLDDLGQPTYRLYRQGVADKDTSKEEMLACLAEGVKVFHTGSLAITPSQLPKLRDVFAVLRENKVLISIDINIRLGASADTPRYLEGVRSLLPLIDIVKASDEDLMAFDLGGNARETARAFYAEMGQGLFVLTEGDGGATIFVGDQEINQKVHPVVNVVDTVGAGDTFHSAFLAELFRDGEFSLRGSEALSPKLQESLNFASAAAAINVSKAGCSPPTYDEVKDYLMPS